MAKGALAVAVAALVVALAAGRLSGPETLSVTPEEGLVEVAAANPGATLVLTPGVHSGGVLDVPVTVRGSDGATVLGPLEVRASGVRLVDVDVRGGDNGILVRDVDDVVLDGVSVTGAELHGIEVVDAVVRIRDCTVSGLLAQRSQGIEIRNAAGRGRSLIEGCRVTGGQEGIVTHVTRAEITGNSVTGTTLRGIAILEMSEVLAVGNRVEDVTGAAFYCGDMSTCDVQRNVVRNVHDADNGIRSQRGQAAVVWYYSGARFVDNDFRVEAEPAIDVYQGGVLTDSSPLGVWPNGWSGMLPAIPIAMAALLGFVLTYAVTRAWLTRREALAPSTSREWNVTELVYALVVIGFAVQSFHMLEHVVQVIQVEVLDSEIRAGLLGQRFNVEWTHFVFNVAVLGFMGGVWKLGRGSTRSLSGASNPAAWFAAGIVAQTYHTIEHTVKIIQRIATRVDPAPGIFGDDLGLVWFHFAINLVVYVGLAAGVVPIIRERYHERERQQGAVGDPVPA